MQLLVHARLLRRDVRRVLAGAVGVEQRRRRDDPLLVERVRRQLRQQVRAVPRPKSFFFSFRDLRRGFPGRPAAVGTGTAGTR